jgi:class 3 adenylate cyclase
MVPRNHSLDTVRLIFLLAAVQAVCAVVATPIRSHGRRPAAFPATNGGTTTWNGKRPRRGTTLPVHRSILAVDIEGSTKRTNPVKEELRQQVYRLVVEALGSMGIDDTFYDPFIDRGDGVLVLLHPADQFPKPLLLSRLIPTLADLLVLHNNGIPLAEYPRILRLRAVVHAGEVHHDGKGPFGEDLDVAFRLLDAPKFKAHLRHLTAPLALVVSDEIYRAVIRHGYEGIDDGEFSPIVNVNVAERRRRGWVHFPRVGEFPVSIPAQAARAC